MQKFKERFDTLSDAILAIAMTILVLEIKTPATMGDIGDFTRNIGLLLALLLFLIFGTKGHKIA